MEQSNAVCAGSNPWLTLIWLVAGPLPLLLVLALGTRHVAEPHEHDTVRPPAAMAAISPKQAHPAQATSNSTVKIPEGPAKTASTGQSKTR